MKKLLAAILPMFAVGISPAPAQERLLDFIEVAKSCAGDIEKLCKDILPGGGRIKACMKSKVGQLSPACFESILDVAIREHAKTKTLTLKPGVTPGLQVHTPNARNYAYCELAPIMGSPPDIAAEFYNTTGTSGPEGGCPAAVFASIDEKKLSAELGAAFTYMNPTPQTARRHWVMDQNWVYEVGETFNFNGVASTWMASMGAKDLLATISSGPYRPTQIRRNSKYLYEKGKTVHLMRTNDGKTYVMQSYATEIDPTLTIDQLPELGAKLKNMPEGWTYETKVLDRDLTIEPGKAGKVAHIIRDELHNVYEGCGFDAACSFVP